MKVYKHPEWRRLLEALSLKIEVGRLYTYEELAELAGIDIRMHRGRQQFLRFAREILERESLHFENVRNEGYRVVLAREQAGCSMRRLISSKRKMHMAGKIASHVQFEHLTPAEKNINLDLCMRLARLEEVVVMQTKEIRKLARGVELGRLPHPLLEQPKEKDGASDVQ